MLNQKIRLFINQYAWNPQQNNFALHNTLVKNYILGHEEYSKISSS